MLIHTKKSQSFVLFSIFLLFCIIDGFCGAQDISRLAATIGKSQRSFSGLRFDYVSTSIIGGSAAVEESNQYYLCAPDGESPHQFWRKWLVFSKSEDGPLLEQFTAFNGDSTTSYKRSAEQRGSSSGLMYPVVIMDNLQRNRFEQVLFTSIFGISYFEDRQGLLTNELMKFGTAKKVTGTAGTTFNITASRNGADFSSTFAGKPISLVEGFSLTFQGEETQGFTVETFGRYKDVSYPKTGEFRIAKSGSIPSVHYKFSVSNVETLAPGDIKDWFPAFPPNTVMANHAMRTTLVIPPDDDDVKGANRD